MSKVFLNGEIIDAEQASISPMDRGFLLSDGVYEVIPAFNGVLFRAEPHLERLERSLAETGIANPYSRPQWLGHCEALLAQNGGGQASIYLQVTRGAPAKRDHAFPGPEVPPTVFMSIGSLPAATAVDAPDAQAGAAGVTLEDIRWSRCDIKSVSLLPNVLLRQQTVEAGALESFLVRDGLVTEGASSNVFLVKDGRVATPPLSRYILAGVTRALVVDLCRANGLPMEERPVVVEELATADELWVCSSTKDLVPIVTLDGRPVGDGRPGPVWKAVAQHYRAYKRSVCG